MKIEDNNFIGKRLKSFAYAFRGITALIKNEPNARIHLAATVLVLAMGIGLRISPLDWALLFFAIGLVFVAELLNTAIEKLADATQPKWDKKIGLIKDYSAAAVLVSAIIAAIIGLLVFLPPLVQLIRPG